MSEKSDAQLLHEYAQAGNEAAFREIVIRYADLVYSSALRQTSCPDLAHDVAQSVFADLARKANSLAKSLKKNASLLGWLFRGTRFAALNQMRENRRRQIRESKAMDMLSAAVDPASDTELEWERVRSILDETMADLGEQDREALLLRFFKNQGFGAIGDALGVSEDAAQKRVGRALERLRAEFNRRGVTTTALALSTGLSANAVTIAPAGLSTILADTALIGTTTATLTTIQLSKTIAMTAVQKTIIAAACIGAVGTGIFQAHQAAILRTHLADARQQQVPLVGRIEELTSNYSNATNQLAALQAENQQLKSGSADVLRLRAEVTRLRSDSRDLARLKGGGSKGSQDSVEDSLLGRVKLLKQRLEHMPEAGIPEFQYLTEHDWIYAADRNLNSDDDYRAAFSDLRGRAESDFLDMAAKALRNYLATNGNQVPTDLSQLKPFFENPPPDQILQRYMIVHGNNAPSATGAPDWTITIKEPDSGEIPRVGPDGAGGTSADDAKEMAILAPAMKAAIDAAATINNRKSIALEDLVPYLTTSEQQAAYQTMIQRRDSHAKQQLR